MNDKIIETLIDVNKTDSAEKAWEQFSACTLDEKKVLLSRLLDLANTPKNTNKAVVMPNGASVIKRKLKPGVEFNTWYQAWLPPIKPENRGGEEVRDYFPIPTRVINLRSPDNDDEFLTIGFVYSPFDSVEELLDARPEDLKESEAKRGEVNDELLTQSEVEFYYVASDDIYGV